MTRYALYVMPATHTDLWRAGSAVLGYDAATGEAVPHPDAPSFDEGAAPAHLAEPTRYGFHGTLKAPFSLAPGATRAGLEAALAAFCAARRPFSMRLEAAEIGSFVALVAPDPPPALRALADDCVVAFDAFRAPLAAAERARRRPERLSAGEVAMLDRWGYPLVFDHFTYHMTLSGRLEPGPRARYLADVAPLFAAALARPFVVDAVALFAQEGQGRFRVVARVPFGTVS